MMSKRFWRATAERAAKTAAQSALLVIGADQLNALSADWAQVAGFGLGGAVLSVLTSIASSRVGDPTPSLVPPEEVG
jgi:hypothetical protein